MKGALQEGIYAERAYPKAFLHSGSTSPLGSQVTWMLTGNTAPLALDLDAVCVAPVHACYCILRHRVHFASSGFLNAAARDYVKF